MAAEGDIAAISAVALLRLATFTWTRGASSLYARTKPAPGESDPLRLTPLELFDRLAVQVLPPRIYRHRYFGVRMRMAAHGKFPRLP